MTSVLTRAPCATPLRSERGPVHTVPLVHDKEQSSDRSYPTSEPTGAGAFRGSDGFRFSPQQAQGAEASRVKYTARVPPGKRVVASQRGRITGRRRDL